MPFSELSIMPGLLFFTTTTTVADCNGIRTEFLGLVVPGVLEAAAIRQAQLTASARPWVCRIATAYFATAIS